MKELKDIFREALPLFIAFVAAAMLMGWMEEKKKARVAALAQAEAAAQEQADQDPTAQ